MLSERHRQLKTTLLSPSGRCCQPALMPSSVSLHAQAINGHDNCSLVRACVYSAIGRGLIGGPNGEPAGSAAAAAVVSGTSVARRLLVRALEAVSSGSGGTEAEEYERKAFLLAVWFLIFFTARHSIGHTLALIPYDALGQELSDNNADRQRLFAWKSFFNFAGVKAASRWAGGCGGVKAVGG